jgi:hypothetical protein
LQRHYDEQDVVESAFLFFVLHRTGIFSTPYSSKHYLPSGYQGPQKGTHFARHLMQSDSIRHDKTAVGSQLIYTELLVLAAFVDFYSLNCSL